MRVAASLRRPNFAKLSSAGVKVPVDSAKGATTFGTRPRSTTTRLASTESTAHSWPRTACQQKVRRTESCGVHLSARSRTAPKMDGKTRKRAAQSFNPPLLLQGLPTKLIFYPTLLLIH